MRQFQVKLHIWDHVTGNEGRQEARFWGRGYTCLFQSYFYAAFSCVCMRLWLHLKHQYNAMNSSLFFSAYSAELVILTAKSGTIKFFFSSNLTTQTARLSCVLVFPHCSPSLSFRETSAWGRDNVTPRPIVWILPTFLPHLTGIWTQCDPGHLDMWHSWSDPNVSKIPSQSRHSW